MKGWIATVILFCTITKITSQQATVRGKVVNPLGYPLKKVRVTVKKSDKRSETDSKGMFEIQDLEKGTFTFVFSHGGFKTKKIRLAISDKEMYLSKIVLYEGNEILEKVDIDTERVNIFSRKKNAYVSKLPLQDIDNPQVYSTVSSELLASQQIFRFEEALQNVVGVDKLWSPTGRSDDGVGYYSIRGFFVQPQLVNGVPGITNGIINPSHVERIEVLKGPSATLFGSTMTSYGGLLNIVTKKPYRGTGGSIAVTGGSFGAKKIDIDVNVHTERRKDISFRLNTGFQTENSFQDMGFEKALFISPALTYKINRRWSLMASYEIASIRRTNPVFLFLNKEMPLAFKNVEELGYDPKKSLTSDDVYVDNLTQNYRGEIRYQIAKRWSSQTILAGSSTRSGGNYTYLYNIEKKVFGLYVQTTDGNRSSLNIQQNITGDFKIGNLRNRMIIGLDYLDLVSANRDSEWKRLHVVTPQGVLVNVRNFANLPIRKENVDFILEDAETKDIYTRQNIAGAYISDLINVFPELSIMVGIRYDRFQDKGDRKLPSNDAKRYVKSAFSPKFGIVHQPIMGEISLFANYQNGFSYVYREPMLLYSTDSQEEAGLQPQDLEKANQLESGIKTNVLGDRLETTLSYYHIVVDNKVIGSRATEKERGKVSSQGIELEVNANPIKGCNLRGGWSYNEAKITESTTSPERIGTRFGEAGPKITYYFWGDYQFQKGPVKDVGLGFGGFGGSTFNVMANHPEAGVFTLPSYFVLHASAYYKTKNIRLGLKVNNLTDSTYYKGWSTLTPQKARAFLANLTYMF